MSKPTLTKITLDSTDLSSYKLKWVKNDTYSPNPIKNITIQLKKTVSSVINIDDSTLLNADVVVTRGVSSSTETTIFKGVVVSYEVQGPILILKCSDPLFLTTKRSITYSFDKDIDTEAGVISEIFKTLINDYTDLTANDTSVTNSGNDLVLSKFICKSETIYSKCEELAKVLGWVFYYDPTDQLVYFEPQGNNVNSNVVEFGTNVANIPKWDSDSKDIVNELTVQGAEQEMDTTVSGQIGVTSGYTTDSIQLAYVPLSIRVLCDASDPPTTEKVIGVPSSTTTYDAYVDKTKKQLIWSDEFTPGGSDYVIVEYTYAQPVPIIVDDSASIAQYGKQEQTIVKDSLKDVDDAESFATEFIAANKDPVLQTKLKVFDITDLDIGQKIQVKDSEHNIDKYFYITNVQQKYPYTYDTITVKDKLHKDPTIDYNEVITRVKELERKNKEDFTSTVQVKKQNDEIISEDRYLKMEHTYLTGETLIFDSVEFGILDTNKFDDPGVHGFVLGHPSYGVLGTSELGSGDFEEITEVLAQNNSKYIELFYDDDFEDSVNTTADWDTSNEQVEQTDGEIAVSNSFAIDRNNSEDTAFTEVTFTITGTNLDQLTYYVGEYDDSDITYSEVTVTGTTTSRTGTLSLSNTNKHGLNWKIENTGGTTATITKLSIEYDLND